MKILSGPLTCLALLLPVVALAAAGGKSYSAYLQKIPAAPLSAAEAQAKSAAVNFDEQLEALTQESAHLSSAAPGVTPTMPGAADTAAAERMAAQMSNMSDAERMAMAMQMMHGAAPPMASGAGSGKEWSAAEQDFARRLDEHQGREGDLQSESQSFSGRAMAQLQDWGIEHGEIIALELAATQAPMRNYCLETHALRLKYARQQEKLATQHLPILAGLISRHRVLATEQVGFVDHLATLQKSVTSPVNQAAYVRSRQLAVNLLVSQLNLARQAFEYGVEWQDKLLQAQKPASCTG